MAAGGKQDTHLSTERCAASKAGHITPERFRAWPPAVDSRHSASTVAERSGNAGLPRSTDRAQATEIAELSCFFHQACDRRSSAYAAYESRARCGGPAQSVTDYEAAEEKRSFMRKVSPVDQLSDFAESQRTYRDLQVAADTLADCFRDRQDGWAAAGLRNDQTFARQARFCVANHTSPPVPA